jgi:hypothetical protein
MAPVPKRSTERRRRNLEGRPERSTYRGGPVVAPPPSEEWHPVARRWYDALGESGQSVYYEPSDWATAFYVAEAMTRNLNGGARFSAQLFASVMSAMTSLLATEGERRRARLEIERETGAALAPVDDLDAYR